MKANRLPLMFVSLFSLIIICVTICGAYVFQMLIDYEGIIDEMYEHNSSNIFIHFLSAISHNNIGKLLFFLIFMFGMMLIVYAIRGNIVSLMSKKIDLSLIEKYI